MSYPKLQAYISEALSRMEMGTPTPLQKQVLGPLKGGQDMTIVAPKGSGRTTALIITTLQIMTEASVGDNPRALIFVKDKAAAMELEEAFAPFIRPRDLRVFAAYDQHDLQGQKDLIYDGVDIMIGTPSRILKLFLQNGMNLAELKLMAIDDGEFLRDNNGHTAIVRISDSLERVQKVIFCSSTHSKIDIIQKSCMTRAKRIEFSED